MFIFTDFILAVPFLLKYYWVNIFHLACLLCANMSNVNLRSTGIIKPCLQYVLSCIRKQDLQKQYRYITHNVCQRTRDTWTFWTCTFRFRHTTTVRCPEQHLPVLRFFCRSPENQLSAMFHWREKLQNQHRTWWHVCKIRFSVDKYNFK